jgi:multidrug efflux system outer membrane protein
MRTILPTSATLAACALLAACAIRPAPPPSAADAQDAPAQWQAPLPHEGRLTDLQRWWQQFDDPLLSDLLVAAQQLSPTVAAARSRIEQARATQAAAILALSPTGDASVSASRGRADLSLPLGNTFAAAAQARWELDVFGGNRAARDAADARLAGASATWHDARVSVAAEVANNYTSLRACEAQVAQLKLDLTSRTETARLTDLSADAGVQPPSSAALARASAAQARATLTQQRAACDATIKGIVALTGIAEPALRERLGGNTARLPQPADLSVASIPAQALAQRPDVFIAERNLVAASADVAQAQALRYPRITLAGSVGAARFSSSAGSVDGAVWSLGPLSVTMPLFDASVRRANVDAARARYDEAVLAYRGRLRDAVREVEQALISLQSTAARSADAQLAVEGFDTSFKAAELRYKGGLASLFELEDARRSSLLAENALIDLQRERTTAWIGLYRALGGGWTRETPDMQ